MKGVIDSEETAARILQYPVHTKSAETRVLDTGTHGSPVLMLHGLGSRADRWAHNLRPLADRGFRVLAVDLPGHGFASKTDVFDYSVNGYAEFVHDVIEALQLSEPIIVGTSLGANIAMHYAVKYPRMAKALVLVGPLGLAPLGSETRRALSTSIADTRKAAIEAKLTALVSNTDQVDAGWVEEEWRCNNSAGAAHAFSRIAQYVCDRIDDDVIGDRLKHAGASLPTLLVWGEDDRLLPISQGRAGQALLPAGTDLVVIHQAGHAPYFERPAIFNSRVGTFLDSIRTAEQFSEGSQHASQ
jgi:pimeloyl-ACP methyl ester carboxylesterase